MLEVVTTQGGVTDDRPLVTFALFAYNQEKYVRDAIEGALAQTYSPLEIIISDDCSTDQTYAIANEMVGAYKGVHKVILNRNEQNIGKQGITGHVEKIMKICTGDLVILAAGDDISVPQRTEVLVSAWLKASKPMALCSDVWLIDQFGQEINDMNDWFNQIQPLPNESKINALIRLIKTGVPALFGCSEAFNAQILKLFEKLPENIWYEDKVMSMRAMLSGEILYTPEKLVHYRLHDANISISREKSGTSIDDMINEEKRRITRIDNNIDLLKSYKNDILFAISKLQVDNKSCFALLAIIEDEIKESMNRRNWWNLSFIQKLKLTFSSGFPRDLGSSNVFALLSWNHYAYFKIAYRQLRKYY